MKNERNERKPTPVTGLTGAKVVEKCSLVGEQIDVRIAASRRPRGWWERHRLRRTAGLRAAIDDNELRSRKGRRPACLRVLGA